MFVWLFVLFIFVVLFVYFFVRCHFMSAVSCHDILIGITVINESGESLLLKHVCFHIADHPSLYLNYSFKLLIRKTKTKAKHMLNNAHSN